MAPRIAWFTIALAGCGGAHPHTETASSNASSAPPTEAASAAPASSAQPETASNGTPASAAPASSAPPAANEPEYAMHVVSQPDARGWFAHVDIERRADGSLLFRGQDIGRMSHGRVFTTEGQTVPLDGRISIGARGHREHFEPQPDGSIRMDSGATVSIDPSGDVQLVRHGTPTPAHVHIEGYHPDARHMAETLVIYGVMKADLASR